MNTPSKLGADSLGLVAVFAATLGIGATVGPAAPTNPATPRSAITAAPPRR